MTVPTTTVGPARALTPEERATDAAGDRAFAAKLFGAVAKSSPGNLFVSPTSARMALSMTLAGARGETASELEAVLGATPRTHDVAAVLGQEWAGLATPSGNDEWLKNQSILLRTANRLFAQKGRTFQPSFIELTRSRYGAPVEALDFAHGEASARANINDWVEKETQQRIKNLLSNPLPAETKLVLVNALYFKAAWDVAFREHATTFEPFFAAGSSKKVPMMNGTSRRRFGETSDAHLVELAYGAAGRNDLAMLLIVPKAKDGLAAIEQQMSPEKLASWARLASNRVEVALALPKFRIESTLDLTKTIAGLGAPTAFQFPKADFSGIDGTRELFIGLVVQKTFVEVDEKGTEAAAATAVAMAAGAAPREPPKPVVVRADRPFLFLIRDTVRDRIVFMGRVASP